ncbi:hypothetical protein HYN48_08005 [Flavobacterium magnum]|uniref:Lipocalin-like domain-containing protein n=1 Tax=Flavobacterium magnum TaxID=2162713 RepID=A0A2S0REH7_9FLAO|nr:hypothetical protein [Flavobacterium magnum]AWA30025.1 hypothetical protein HYN48_08005 [Flavobacterium magnum]
MKKSAFLFLLSAALFSCHHDVTQEDISAINGYWEISQTVGKDGLKKDFKINETIDYFQVRNNKGFRKKVMPQFDGRYIINDQKEDLGVKKDGDDFYICYVTPYGKWRDRITEVNAVELVLTDSSGTEFHYKRPVKFSVK